MNDPGRLREAGLRVTAARLAIMQTVSGGDHLDVEAIHRGVCERVGQVSLQAVYDSLNALQRGGLLRRIEPAGSPTRYETRVGDNHHHLVCRSCGRVADVDCAVGHAPCLEPASDAGYLVDEADVIYWGLCPPCRAEAGSAQPDSARV
ncbi:Fur family transcriptional regulator [Microbispora bryophytorum]|uniref:Transcriptional repressor n=1 Tax=Microbispora bryophytorum TaxID=1460882 RepID=A0A8H9GTE5_9ACTN|nr:Fur family transcriptional regulator [Microbispora bryophytorum]MBD3135621.1 transcriptional repressor [Microbispora bryophytorum]TQS09798.1 transcriptional repressor [Microbispora bryophytorum]GGN98573.1 transcriptional repressor [Microbispora bryophytorum]